MASPRAQIKVALGAAQQAMTVEQITQEIRRARGQLTAILEPHGLTLVGLARIEESGQEFIRLSWRVRNRG